MSLKSFFVTTELVSEKLSLPTKPLPIEGKVYKDGHVQARFYHSLTLTSFYVFAKIKATPSHKFCWSGREVNYEPTPSKSGSQTIKPTIYQGRPY